MPDESKAKRAENVAEVLGKELKPRKRWTGKYILQIYSGHLKASKYIRIAVECYNNKMFNEMKKDTRPRLSTQFATDEDKDLVKNELPNDERRDILLREAKEKV